MKIAIYTYGATIFSKLNTYILGHCANKMTHVQLKNFYHYVNLNTYSTARAHKGLGWVGWARGLLWVGWLATTKPVSDWQRAVTRRQNCLPMISS